MKNKSNKFVIKLASTEIIGERLWAFIAGVALGITIGISIAIRILE